MNQPIVFLNGDYMPLENAYVPVLDRGFIFGDGVYEVIPVYARRTFRLTHHLQRLQNSMQAIHIDNPYSDAQWGEIIEQVIARNEDDEQSIYLQITRGVAMRDHRFPENNTPTVFIMSSPLASISTEELQQGFHAITLNDIRWDYCNIKSIALLPNILLRHKAEQQGAAEAILIRNGEVTEGTASNVFMVNNATIRTPAKSDCLLPGITRDLVVELAQQHAIPCEQAAFSENEMLQADEVWITSSLKEIAPITHINGQTIGNGKPGPLWQRMFSLYQDYKQTLRNPAAT